MTARPQATLPKLSTTLLLIALLTTTVLLVSGRDLAHRLTLSVCTDTGDCGSFPDSPPTCQYHGRDRVVARESFAFAQQWPAENSRLIQFGDDSAEVIVETNDDSTDVYRFGRWEDAQRWVIDNSDELGNTADVSAGPWSLPIREGYLRAVRLAGLDHEPHRDPVASAFLIDEPSGPGTHGVLRQNTAGDIVEVTVIIPLDTATEELKEFANNLGFWGFFSYTIDLAPGLDPLRLTFGGPATDAWSLSQLRSSSAHGEVSSPSELPEYASHGNAVLRSFALDLRLDANEELYRDIFAMESILGVAAPLLTSETWISAGERAERYAEFENRVVNHAVAVETTHTPQQDQDLTVEALQHAIEGLILQAGPIEAPETRLVDAQSADLAIAGSSFEPLLTCELPEEEPEPEEGIGGLF